MKSNQWKTGFLAMAALSMLPVYTLLPIVALTYSIATAVCFWRLSPIPSPVHYAALAGIGFTWVVTIILIWESDKPAAPNDPLLSSLRRWSMVTFVTAAVSLALS